MEVDEAEESEAGEDKEGSDNDEQAEEADGGGLSEPPVDAGRQGREVKRRSCVV